MEKLEQILDYSFIKTSHFNVTVMSILSIIAIIVFARLINWLIQRLLRREVEKSKIELTHSYSIGIVSKYVIYLTAFILILESFDVNITVLLGASAALFVGLGLGLQDIFKDSFAGMVILYGKVIRVKDIIELEGIIGEVIEIDIRSSKLVTKDDIIIIIPNHKLILEKVINWSRNYRSTRFSITVGVAYGSDTELVKNILLEVTKKHPKITDPSKSHVLFQDFGDSALQFELYFYSEHLFDIEAVKSDLRFAVDKAFREAKVTIPFPQRDLHIKRN